MSINVSELIAEFIKNAEIANEKFDYTDKKAAKKHNAAAATYRKTAKRLAEGTTEVRPEFMELLQSSSEDVAISCAACIIELMVFTPEQYSAAVEYIEKYVKTSSNKINVIGCTLYLKKLKKEI